MGRFMSLFLIYLACIFTGSEFIETFAYIDSNRWIAEEGGMHCTYKGQEVEFQGWQRRSACAITKANSFDHIAMFGNADKDMLYGDHVTYLTMRNDCNNDAECCKQEVKKCTDLTTGKLHSVHSFSHGKFELLARAAPEHGIPDALSCFALSEQFDSHEFLISMCFQSSQPNHVQFSWHYGENHWKARHLIGFDATQNVAKYGIIWEIHRVTFKVNDRAIVVSSLPKNLPQNPQLRIKLSLLPLNRDQGFNDLVERDIKFFRISYSENVDAPKTQLFVVQRGTHDVTIAVIAVFTVTFIMSIMLLFFYWKRHEENKMDGYNMLLENDVDELKGPRRNPARKCSGIFA